MDDASDYDDGAKNAVVVEYVEIMALLGAERDLFSRLTKEDGCCCLRHKERRKCWHQSSWGCMKARSWTPSVVSERHSCWILTSHCRIRNPTAQTGVPWVLLR